jgi:hypothetical protein
MKRNLPLAPFLLAAFAALAGCGREPRKPATSEPVKVAASEPVEVNGTPKEV